jgi:DNA-binding transcriptional ArsR family regulator
MFKELDPLLHSELRLKIISLLVGVESAEFNWLLEQTDATRGNLSVQISKLKDAGYIDVKKGFRKNYPLTTCRITEKGARPGFRNLCGGAERVSEAEVTCPIGRAIPVPDKVCGGTICRPAASVCRFFVGRGLFRLYVCPEIIKIIKAWKETINIRIMIRVPGWSWASYCFSSVSYGWAGTCIFCLLPFISISSPGR